MERDNMIVIQKKNQYQGSLLKNYLSTSKYTRYLPTIYKSNLLFHMLLSNKGSVRPFFFKQLLFVKSSLLHVELIDANTV